MADDFGTILLDLTTEIVTAHVSRNKVAAEQLPDLIAKVHAALAELGAPRGEAQPVLKPAVAVRTSVKPDHIVCLEDGKKLKMLKRHLATDHGMSPAEYRVRWNLPKDYPMVAPAYAAKRAELAKTIGLGRKPGSRKGSATEAQAAPSAAAPGNPDAMAAPKAARSRAKKPAAQTPVA
jgi:predicted transcriptional regulator